MFEVARKYVISRGNERSRLERQCPNLEGLSPITCSLRGEEFMIGRRDRAY